jgi:hypothetical protein
MASARPRTIVDKLNNEINVALADPKMKSRLADLGGTVLVGNSAPKYSIRTSTCLKNSSISENGPAILAQNPWISPTSSATWLKPMARAFLAWAWESPITCPPPPSYGAVTGSGQYAPELARPGVRGWGVTDVPRVTQHVRRDVGYARSERSGVRQDAIRCIVEAVGGLHFIECTQTPERRSP